MESEPGSSFCFDAFSSREPISTSLENALKTRQIGIELKERGGETPRFL
jgi:hypothetical protein